LRGINLEEEEMKAVLRYIDEKKVAEMTGLSMATLRNNSWLGWGIPYAKVGWENDHLALPICPRQSTN
jgi:hypothetical protein